MSVMARKTTEMTAGVFERHVEDRGGGTPSLTLWRHRDDAASVGRYGAAVEGL